MWQIVVKMNRQGTCCIITVSGPPFINFMDFLSQLIHCTRIIRCNDIEKDIEIIIRLYIYIFIKMQIITK